jgi:galactofuranose transport system permease protein
MLKDENFKKLLWPAVALLAILLFNVFFTENFLKFEIKDGHLFGSLVDILNRGAPVLMITIGMTLVYATGGIDLSVGSVIAISGAIAAQLIRPGYIHGILEYPDPPTSLLTVLFVPLIVCALLGAWNGFLVAFIGIQPIIATLILMVAGRGIAQLITEGQIPVFIHEPFQFLGGGFFLGLPFPIILSVLLIVGVYLATRKTSLGLFIESSGGNPVAARYMGIKAKMIVLSTYVFCAVTAGLAGLIICSDIQAADANNAGLWLELDAIAAVIIGGTMWGGRFTLAGSVIGALIIQSITTTILAFGIPPEVTLVFKALVIIIVSLIQSEGIQEMVKTMKSRRAQA